MISRLSILAVVAALFCLSTPSRGDENRTPELPAFDVAANPLFPNVNKVLLSLVRWGKRQGRNDFCVVGYQKPSATYAWVYWKQGRYLFQWFPQNAPVANLTARRDYIDLRHDVVKDESQLDGSSYLQTSAFVNDIIQDCGKRGRSYRIGG